MITKTTILKENLKKILTNKYFWISIAVLFLSYIISYISSQYLANTYGKNIPILNDLILNNIPYFKVAFFYDLLSILITLVFFIYAVFKKFEEIPYFIFLLAIFHLIRSVFIILTPLGVPNGGGQGLFWGPTAFYGEYPSGHTGSAFLIFLFSKGILKKIFLVLAILMAALLLMGKGHYSIDLFSAVIFAYAIYTFGEKHLKEKFELKK